VGIILYSLVQIMQGQRNEMTATSAAGAPVGKGSGKAEQGSSH